MTERGKNWYVIAEKGTGTMADPIRTKYLHSRRNQQPLVPPFEFLSHPDGAKSWRSNLLAQNAANKMARFSPDGWRISVVDDHGIDSRNT